MKIQFSLLLAIFFIGVSSCAQKQSVDGRLIHVTILHTNDVHGHAWPTVGIDGVNRGGFAAQAFLIQKIRKEVEANKGALLLLSGGDINTGVPESDLLNAEPDITSMNAIGYDAMVLGNHEFDGGTEKIFKQEQLAKFPFLSANIRFKDPNAKELAKPFVVIEKKGVKFGIIGLTTDDLKKLTLPKYSALLDIKNPVDVAKEEIPVMRAAGAEILVAVTHIGINHTGKRANALIKNDDEHLAEEVPEIPIIIGGHSHTLLKEGVLLKNTLIAQAGEKGENLGRVDFDWDAQNKKVVHPVATVIPILPEQGEDPAIKTLTATYLKQVAKKFDEVVGVTKTNLVGERGAARLEETNLGDLICDIIRKYAKTDIAVFNGGGIRASIPKGNIQMRHIYQAFPFKNTVSTATVDGKLLREIIELGVRNRNQTGSLLQVSGLTYAYNKDQITSLKVGGIEVNPEKMYTLATNNFVITGGDGFGLFERSKNIQDSGKPIDELLIQYLKSHRPVNISTDGRIRAMQ